MRMPSRSTFAVLFALAACCGGCARQTPAPAVSPTPASNPVADSAKPPATVDAPTEVAAAPVVLEMPTAAELAAFVPESGFFFLKLDDFDQFPADASTWTDEGGLLVCNGQPKGYAYTREDFENFTLRCEFRFVPDGALPDAEAAKKYNTGFMLYVQEPHKVWPASLEVQGRFMDMVSIKSNGGVPDLTIQDDAAARESVRLPVGQWNALEIVAHDGAIKSTLNGVVICTSHAGELKSGKLGLQSEGYRVQFKHLRVRLDN